MNGATPSGPSALISGDDDPGRRADPPDRHARQPRGDALEQPRRGELAGHAERDQRHA